MTLATQRIRFPSNRFTVYRFNLSTDGDRGRLLLLCREYWIAALQRFPLSLAPDRKQSLYCFRLSPLSAYRITVSADGMSSVRQEPIRRNAVIYIVPLLPFGFSLLTLERWVCQPMEASVLVQLLPFRFTCSRFRSRCFPSVHVNRWKTFNHIGSGTDIIRLPPCVTYRAHKHTN